MSAAMTACAAGAGFFILAVAVICGIMAARGEW